MFDLPVTSTFDLKKVRAKSLAASTVSHKMTPVTPLYMNYFLRYNQKPCFLHLWPLATKIWSSVGSAKTRPSFQYFLFNNTNKQFNQPGLNWGPGWKYKLHQPDIDQLSALTMWLSCRFREELPLQHWWRSWRWGAGSAWPALSTICGPLPEETIQRELAGISHKIATRCCQVGQLRPGAICFHGPRKVARVRSPPSLLRSDMQRGENERL